MIEILPFPRRARLRRAAANPPWGKCGLSLLCSAVLNLAATANAAIATRQPELDPGVEAATAWVSWEQSLTSDRDYANPYRDVTLRVTFAGPDGRSFTGYGFWDGGRTFKVRAAFPTPGVWTWRMTCSETTDIGLHGRSGRVTVTPYTGANLLYRHGFIKVSRCDGASNRGPATRRACQRPCRNSRCGAGRRGSVRLRLPAGLFPPLVPRRAFAAGRCSRRPGRR
ncbi:MAG: DUF5060 domain-containing protein [Verrucomicrobia bacterium]|nr:DUF5060 domain-containing protein [Verrucomicrobiota bacterium]